MLLVFEVEVIEMSYTWFLVWGYDHSVVAGSGCNSLEEAVQLRTAWEANIAFQAEDEGRRVYEFASWGMLVAVGDDERHPHILLGADLDRHLARK